MKNSICINIQLDTPYLTIKELRKRIGISENTVRKMISNNLVKIAPKMKNDKGAEETKRGAILIDMVGTVAMLLQSGYSSIEDAANSLDRIQ